VWGEKTVQKDFYVGSCSGLVDAVLQGFNGTIFAYGQTVSTELFLSFEWHLSLTIQLGASSHFLVS
jgi:hypothetical protein